MWEVPARLKENGAGLQQLRRTESACVGKLQTSGYRPVSLELLDVEVGVAGDRYRAWLQTTSGKPSFDSGKCSQQNPST